MTNTAIEKLAGSKVLVVGDIMLDRYWYGGTGRISPEAPVPVVRVGNQEERAGGAGNVALNLAAVGCQVTLIGYSGNDEAGENLRAIFSESNIDARLITLDSHPTITKLRVMSRNQQLLRLDFEMNLSDVVHDSLQQTYTECLGEANVVVLSDYQKGTLNDPGFYIQQACEHNIKVVVDPKRADFDAYQGATLVTPNMEEFEASVGVCKDEQEMVERGQELLRTTGVQNLLLTRSEHGMLLLQQQHSPAKIAAQAKEVYDVTGAGDTVVAIVAAALAAGIDLESACELANTAAGIVVGKLGTATVSAAELHARYEHGFDQSVVTEAQLVDLVAAAKAAGQRIVMTNGCFDLLHPGHLAYLEAASKLGDVLIVAVNDDASVARLKGASRPISDLPTRLAMLAGLGSVDYVVPFIEDTPARLIEAILPDVLVKGGDYKAEEVAGYDSVTAAGGEVRILGFLDGYSTSELINSIQSRA